jgi:Transcriptional regulator
MDKKYSSRTDKTTNIKALKRRKRNVIILGIVAVLLSVGTWQGYNTYQALQNSLQKMTKNELPIAEIISSLSTDPFTILVIGLGTNGNDGEAPLADSINLLTINPQNGYAEIIAVPRDSYVRFGETCEWGAGARDKITHATAIDAGGASCLESTMERLFEVEINYYVSMNFVGFVQIVNALGGVEMNVPDLRVGFDNYPGDPYDGMRLDPALKNGEQWCEHDSYRNPFAICFNQFGLQSVDGEEALALARTRHYDSDLGRSMRQTELIKAIADKATTSTNILNIQDLIVAAGDTFETNIPPDQFLDFYNLAKELFSTNSGSFAIRTTQLGSIGDTVVSERIGVTTYVSRVPIISVSDASFKIQTALYGGELILSPNDFHFSIEADIDSYRYYGEATL